MSAHDVPHPSGAIAVIGMAGRFPKARSVAEFWQNLRNGVECISRFSDDELRASGVPQEVIDDPTYVKAFGWLEDVDQFDAGFFEITPREAEVMDPHVRLLLECAWETLEDAGYDPDRYPGRIGVFAGSSMMFYLWQNILPNPKVLESLGFIQAWIVNDRDFVATRLNYKLNLRGPGMTVQTACSTSLVATHLGCQSLLAGESDIVLVGGVTAPGPYKEGYHFLEGGTLSPDGHVRAFDAKGKGMLGGNGVALVALKRLEDALADGDAIRAVIRGTALNNDGTDKVTYTAPSVAGQVQVVLDALEVSGVDPRTISYVECHGTGTPLGDPIEIAALTQAWRTKTKDRGWCPIGSVKTNIGHLDTTAGVAGLIKTVLSLEHKEIAPSLNFETPNPEIDFASSPFFVNTTLRAWETERLPRRAAISSLGMGGTNAHVVLEEAPEVEPGSPGRPHRLLLLSARSPQALDAATQRLAAHLEGAGREQDLGDVAYTTHVGRRAFVHRRAVVCRDTADALDALRKRDRTRVHTGVGAASGVPIAFLFSGQGAQHPNMTRGLYEGEPIYRAELDRCCELLRPLLRRDLRELFFPTAGAEDEAAAALERTEITQPALFAVEYALARLWASWGVEPSAMLGHSIGEYTAACLAGVFSLEDALRLVAARGRLIGGLPVGGGMLAVHLPEEQIALLLQRGLSLAAVNAPELCVVSGPLEAIERLEQGLAGRAVSTRRLHTSHAFHSSLMDPILDAFAAEVKKVALAPPRLPVISCTTGAPLSEDAATDPDYWVRHLRQPVRFADGVRRLLSGGRALLEVGPGESLATLARLSALERPDAPIVASCRHPRESADDQAVLLGALGRLWTAGVAIDWQGFHADERRRRVPLPTYPFERQRYWIERPAAGPTPAAAGAAARPTRKETDLAEWFFVPSWRQAPLADASASAEIGAGSSWLLLEDEEGIGRALAERIVADGANVVRVRAGTELGLAGDVLEIDPRRPEHYRALLDELEKRGRAPREVVHLWSTGPAGRASDAERAALLDRGFFSLLFLGQALAGRVDGAPVRLSAITSGAQDVLGGGPALPERACVLGPCKSMGIELAGVIGRWIDVQLDGVAPAVLPPALEDRLLAELRSDVRDPIVALHGGKRWTLGQEKVRLAERNGTGTPARLRERGTYLITGGLGGIGLVFAELLAETVRARLVLTARSELPARDVWDAWIAEHGEDEATSARIRAVRRLEEKGAEVLVAAADVADKDAMREVIDRSIERFGAVHGVIHCAGLLGSGVIETKTREQAELVLAPKVRGTQVLEQVLAGREPELVVLTSSISTAPRVLAGVDYAAANAYLDAWANGRAGRAGGPHVVAMCWDTWAEVGMATHFTVPEHLRRRHEESLALAVTPREGREAFLRALASGLPQVYVSGIDLRARDDLASVAAPARAEDAVPGAPEPDAQPRATHARPALSTDYIEPARETERVIAGIWQDLLGLDRVGVRDNFFELGGNSLVMMQLNVRLRSIYGLSLPIRELFDTPEVGLLAERIESIRAVTAPGAHEEPFAEIEEFTL